MISPTMAPPMMRPKKVTAKQKMAREKKKQNESERKKDKQYEEKKRNKRKRKKKKKSCITIVGQDRTVERASNLLNDVTHQQNKQHPFDTHKKLLENVLVFF